jgi:adenosylhomocysteine nucleosidase
LNAQLPGSGPTAMLNVKQPPILVVAALSYELQKLKSLAHTGIVLLETGEGMKNAKRQLDDWLEGNDARAVLNIGFAGGLSASLQPGDIVVAREVKDSLPQPNSSLLVASQELPVNFPVRFGIAITSQEILWQADSKRKLAKMLRDEEVGFVDMESTAIADVCATRGLPFLIARSITDLLDEDLPLDFNLCRGEDGRVDLTLVMKATLRKPSSVKGLMELRKRSNLCAERLAEFVVSLSERV